MRKNIRIKQTTLLQTEPEHGEGSQCRPTNLTEVWKLSFTSPSIDDNFYFLCTLQYSPLVRCTSRRLARLSIFLRPFSVVNCRSILWSSGIAPSEKVSNGIRGEAEKIFAASISVFSCYLLIGMRGCGVLEHLFAVVQVSS